MRGQLQTTVIKKKARNRIGFVVLLVLAVLCVLLILGMRYPVVGRQDTIPGIPNTLLFWAALCAMLQSGITLFFTQFEFKSRKDMIVPAFGYGFVGTILWAGCLMLINGAFDRGSTQAHAAYITQKYIHRSRGTDYFLVVRDWQNPTQTVRLRVDPQTYQQFNSLTEVKVITAPGLLKIERIVGVRP